VDGKVLLAVRLKGSKGIDAKSKKVLHVFRLHEARAPPPHPPPVPLIRAPRHSSRHDAQLKRMVFSQLTIFDNFRHISTRRS